MPDFSDAFEPSESHIEVSESPKSLGRLPGGLKAICIIAIILGATGTLAALASGVGLVFGQQVQDAMNPSKAGSAQQQMQAEINAIARNYVVPQTAAVLLHTVTAILLVVGGIMTLKRRVVGTHMLTVGFAASILYLLGETVLNILIQLQAVPIVQKFGDAIMAEQGGQAGGEMGGVLLVAVFVGLGLAVVLAMAKIVFYLIGIFYVRKSHVRALMQA